MVYLFLADGFEEIEAIAPIDLLRRADIPLKTVSIGKSKTVKGSHNISIQSDIMLEEVNIERMEMIILPGGPGTLQLEMNDKLMDIVDYAADRKIWIAAICAAPSILGKRGLLRDRRATCYPGYEKHLKDADISSAKVVVSENFITSKGAGTAVDFGINIVEVLKGTRTANILSEAIQAV